MEDAAGTTATIDASGAGVVVGGDFTLTGFDSINVNNQIRTSANGMVTLTASGMLTVPIRGL